MEKKTLTLKQILETQPALQELEGKDWSIRAGRRVSILAEQLVEQIKAVEKIRQDLFKKHNVKDYNKLSPDKKKELDVIFNDFLENEEHEIVFPLMTESLLGDVKLKGSTYRLLAFFFEGEQEDKPEPVKPEDVTE